MNSRRVIIGTGVAVLIGTAFILGAVTLGGALAQSGESSTEQCDDDSREASSLAGQATLTRDQATAAALAAVPGSTVTKVELETEHGTLVYGVEVVDASGKHQDVKIDAKTGTVVKIEVDDGPDTDGERENCEHD